MKNLFYTFIHSVTKEYTPSPYLRDVITEHYSFTSPKPTVKICCLKQDRFWTCLKKKRKENIKIKIKKERKKRERKPKKKERTKKKRKSCKKLKFFSKKVEKVV